MKIIAIDPRVDPLWQRLVNCKESDVFHSPGWMTVLANTYGFDTRAYLLLDEFGEPVAGLPYCNITDIRTPRAVTLPFSDYCDPLVDDLDQWQALTAALFRHGTTYKTRCLHNNVILDDPRLSLVNKARWHGIEITGDDAMIWVGLDASARRAIRKAKRCGVQISVADSKEELRSFFELHLQIRKYKYQLLAQPYKFLENIWDQFIAKGDGFLMLARYQGELVGGALFLEWRQKLYYKFNASNPELVACRPNDLVLWEGIKYALDRGINYLDLGLSDWEQEGLVRYKRKYATDEKTISFLTHGNGAANKSTPQIDSLLPKLTDLFTDESVPDAVTERAGEVLYRFFV